MENKISVIVIGYNIENYISNCLDTLVNQTYPNYEIIFVNDGSKDATLDIAREYAKKYPKLHVFDKTNGGIVSARKEGLRHATGEYVCFVDGDDWAPKTMVEVLERGLHYGNNNFDIVVSRFYSQDENGGFVLSNNETMEDIMSGDSFLKNILDDSIPHYMFAKLYKKSFLISVGYLDFLEITIAEDWMTNAIVGIFNPNVHFINDCTYYYRYNALSCTRDGSNKVLEQIKTTNFIIETYKKKGVYTTYENYLKYLWFSYVHTYVVSPKVHYSVKKELVKLTKEKLKGWKSNPIAIERYNSFSMKHKIIFFVSYHFPRMSKILNIIYHKLKKRRIRDEAYYLINAEKRKKSHKKYLQSIKKNLSKRSLYLIGTSSRSNIGDHLIAFSEISLLNKHFAKDYNIIEITEDCYCAEKKYIASLIKSDDIIFITGGGFLGDLWLYEENIVRDIIKTFTNNKTIIFPQTVFFTDTTTNNEEYIKSLKTYKSRDNIFYMLRDEKSYLFFKNEVSDSRSYLFPDMALLTDIVMPYHHQDGILLCLRSDKEKSLSNSAIEYIKKYLQDRNYAFEFGTTLAKGKNNGDISLDARELSIRDKLKEFGNKKLVVTDRLHGMIISCLAGTSCIAFDNTSKKVSGVYNKWLKKLNNVTIIDDVKQFDEAFEQLISRVAVPYTKEYLSDNEKELTNTIMDILKG